MARRGLVGTERLPELIGWLSKVSMKIAWLSELMLTNDVRRFILTFEKVPTPLGPMCVTRQPMFYGRLPERRTPQR